MPLDEDHLSIMDLFELKSSAQAALDKPDNEDEARNLLRGILHGVDTLRRFKPETAIKEEEGPAAGKIGADANGPEIEEGKYEALGLSRRHADSELAFLQGFALYELASLIEPVEHKALSTASGSKKRKVDPREPTDPAEWLDMACQKFRYASNGAVSSDGLDPWFVLTVAWGKRCCYDRGLLALARDDLKKAVSSMNGDGQLAFSTGYIADFGGHDYASVLEMAGDPLGAVFEAYQTFFSLIEGLDQVDSQERLKALSVMTEPVVQALDQYGTDPYANAGEYLSSDNQNLPQQWLFNLISTAADAELTEFVILEEQLEAKYRPEEDDERDEDEIKPLPVDAEDVQHARKKGEAGEITDTMPRRHHTHYTRVLLAIERLRTTLAIADNLPVTEKPVARLEQYKKVGIYL